MLVDKILSIVLPVVLCSLRKPLIFIFLGAWFCCLWSGCIKEKGQPCSSSDGFIPNLFLVKKTEMIETTKDVADLPNESQTILLFL